MPTIRDFATQTGTVDRLLRAISFDQRLEQIWTVPVSWNWSLRNSAGNASRSRGISLYPGLRAATEAELRATFLHEVAHICEAILYSGRMGHSQGWWEAMIRLGEQPWNNRYHSIPSCGKAAALQSGLNRTEGSLEELEL